MLAWCDAGAARSAGSRSSIARSAFSSGGHFSDTTARLGDSCTSAAHFRGIVLSRTGPRVEAAPHERPRGHWLCHERQGTGSDSRGAAISPYDGAKAYARGNCGGHAPTQPHAATSARRRWIGQNNRRAASHAGGDGERIPSGADGANGNSRHAALPGGAQAAGAVVAEIQNRAADRVSG